MTTSTASSVSFFRVRSMSNIMTIWSSHDLLHGNPLVQYVIYKIIRHWVCRIVVHFCGGGIQKHESTRFNRVSVPPWSCLRMIFTNWISP